MKQNEKPNDKKTKIKETTKEDFIVNSLDLQGSFFQQKCIETISKTELWSVGRKEYPVSIDDKHHTKIDIIGFKSVPQTIIEYYAIVECKKVSDMYKTWVFMIDRKLHDDDYSADYKERRDCNVFVDAILSDEIMNSKYPNYKQAGLSNFVRIAIKDVLLKMNGNDIDICYDAYELKLNMDNNNHINSNYRKATTKDNIERACFQVLLGCRGYSQEIHSAPILTGIKYFIPIVVTTAKLQVIDTDADNIDIKTGTIADKNKVTIRNVNWLVYNYRPSYDSLSSKKMTHYDFVGIPNKKYRQNLLDSLNYFNTIFFVNSESLSELLRNLEVHFN